VIPDDDIPMAPAYRRMARQTASLPLGETLVEVVVSWGDDCPLAVAHLRPGERFVLASQGSTDPDAPCFVHPAIDRGAHPLVERIGRDCQVTPPGGAPFVLARDERTVIDHDGVRYAVRHVPVAERLPPRRTDRLFGAATALSLVGTLAAGAWLRGVDHDHRLTRDDGDTLRMLIAHGPSQRAVSYAPTHAEGGVGTEGGTGLRAPGDEGASGLRRAPQTSRTWARPPRRGPSRAETTASAADRVLHRGVFSALGAPGAGPWGALTTGDSDDRHASGAMYGTTLGDARGFEGLGLLGRGWGGGGRGDELVGLGRVQTHGHGTDHGVGMGLGNGGYCGCGAPSPGTSLDAAAIRRVVQRNLGQVRHCYEQALALVPDAEGRIAVRWVIGSEGAVLASEVTDNATGSTPLGECVAHAARRWQFPATDNVVTVNYPFDLSVVE